MEGFILKIELINENQIRCTLTKDDLASRHIKLSELAYGTTKARLLFREMIEKASADYGFVTEDLPLMIEAIPVPHDGIVLVISKVNEPEELDTRFSDFTAYDEDSLDESMLSEMDEINSLEETSLIDFFKNLYERIEHGKTSDSVSKSVSEDTIIISFEEISDIIRLSKDFSAFFKGSSSLYRSPKGTLSLILKLTDASKENIKSLCIMASEYGKAGACLNGSESHIKEHFDTIIESDALGVLAAM